MNNKKKISPPYLAELLMRFFFPDCGSLTTIGDMNEIFNHIAASQGLFKAKIWYIMETLKSIIPLLLHSLLWGSTMLKNYIKIAFRNLFKYKTYSVINILGLSVGLTCCILIYLYSVNEFSYDRFHKDNDNIYRLISDRYDASGAVVDIAGNTPAVMREFIPEFFGDKVEQVTTIMTRYGVLVYGDKHFEERVRFVESNFFEMFSFPLLIGSKERVLKNEGSIVLSESNAIKYFGNEDPLGKDIKIIFGNVQKVFAVTGIAEDAPSNSSIQFDFLINIENQREFYTPNPDTHRLKSTGDFSAYNYIRVKAGTNPEFFNKQFDRFVYKYYEKDLPIWRKFGKLPEDQLPFTFKMENIKDIHFNNSVYGGKDISALYTLMAIALIVLIIACINFMNLSLGRASFRFKEIGVRKVIGANRKQLLNQFWSESIIITFISMFAGIILSIAVLPVFNEISEKDFTILSFFSPVNLAALILLCLIVGTIAGSYPSFIMSRAQTVSIIKGQYKFGGRNFITKSMIVLQFSLSILLIVSTFILSDQIDFMINKDLGYNKDGIISVQLQERTPEESIIIANEFKNNISNYSNVKQVSAVSEAFGGGNRSHSPIYYNNKQIMIRRINVDYNFFKTMEIDLQDGRIFSEEFITDTSSIIINQSCLKELGVQNPLGEEVKLFDRIPFKIIGVVEDFNFDPLNEEVEPAIFYIRPQFTYNYALVKIAPQNVSRTIEHLQESWNEIQPDKPFLFSFMNEDLKNFYEEDLKWQAIISYSSAFALIIACMGIFGLTSITISRKIKEIGIRKVLGASAATIVNIILKEFATLILIANLIAWPTAYFIMNNILEDYYYRISIGAEYFIIAGLISISLAVITILYLTLRAAFSNPIDSLRAE